MVNVPCTRTKTLNLTTDNTDRTDLHGSKHSRAAAGAHLAGIADAKNAESLLPLIEIEEIAGIYFESAGELKDVIETDILFTAFHFTNEITVDLDHGAQLFLGQLPFRAYGTQTCAER